MRLRRSEDFNRLVTFKVNERTKPKIFRRLRRFAQDDNLKHCANLSSRASAKDLREAVDSGYFNSERFSKILSRSASLCEVTVMFMK